MKRNIVPYSYRKFTCNRTMLCLLIWFYFCTLKIFQVGCDNKIKNYADIRELGSSQFCEGCYGAVDILLQEFNENKPDLKGPYRMKQKWENFERKICTTDNLKKYVYSPPKMAKVSVSFQGQHLALIVSIF